MVLSRLLFLVVVPTLLLSFVSSFLVTTQPFHPSNDSPPPSPPSSLLLRMADDTYQEGSSSSSMSTSTSSKSSTASSTTFGNWEELHGNYVLRPCVSQGPPRALLHFLGGALVGAAPHVYYRYLLETLSRQGYLVVATPYNLSFDHLQSCDAIIERFETIAPMLARQYGAVPVVGVGHSCGALLQLLITSVFPDTPRAANALLSFNNKPVTEAIPFFEEVRTILYILLEHVCIYLCVDTHRDIHRYTFPWNTVKMMTLKHTQCDSHHDYCFFVCLALHIPTTYTYIHIHISTYSCLHHYLQPCRPRMGHHQVVPTF